MDRAPSGLGTVSLPAWDIFLKNGYPDYKQLCLTYPESVLKYKQRAKPWKMALPFRNYQLILLQFFEFTQTLKHSRIWTCSTGNNELNYSHDTFAVAYKHRKPGFIFFVSARWTIFSNFSSSLLLPIIRRKSPFSRIQFILQSKKLKEI